MNKIKVNLGQKQQKPLPYPYQPCYIILILIIPIHPNFYLNIQIQFHKIKLDRKFAKDAKQA